MDPFGGIMSGDFVSQIYGLAVANLALTVVLGLIFVAAAWAMTGFVWLYIGRKSGLDRDWMPFVPIARTIYQLHVVDEQWWKMFLLGDNLLYSFILFQLIVAISSGAWLMFAIILVAIYNLAVIGYNIYWRYKFYVAFGIKEHMALLVLVPGLAFVATVVDFLIAFTDLFNYGGTAMATPISSGARNFVNVPKANEGAGGTITGLSGMYAGQTIPMAANEPLLIGRDGSCNLIVDRNAEKLSRRHCSVVFEAARGAYTVTDHSSNGTYVEGGSRLPSNIATQLPRGAVIELGSRENRFKLN